MPDKPTREPGQIRQDSLAKAADLDGDEVGYLVAKVAEIKRQRHPFFFAAYRPSPAGLGQPDRAEYLHGA